MSEPRQYGFEEELKYSQRESSNGNIRDILVANIAGALDAKVAHKENDRSGVDWWVECIGARFLAVDCKIRREDFALRGHDDVALEIWSVIERKRPGWTRDTTKRSDYILWLWEDTGRWMLVPFHMLCIVFIERGQQWARKYKTAKQSTPAKNGREAYHSECVFVPRREIWRELYIRFGGRTS